MTIQGRPKGVVSKQKCIDYIEKNDLFIGKFVFGYNTVV